MQIDERRIIEAELAGAHGLDYEERPGFFPYRQHADQIVTALEKARADATARNSCDISATDNESSVGYGDAERAATLRRGLPMSAIKVGMRLKATVQSSLPAITVTAITDKGFTYSHERHYWRPGEWSETGECYGVEAYSFYEEIDS